MFARRPPQAEGQHNWASEGGDWRLVLVSVDPGGEPLATVSYSPGMSFILKCNVWTVRASLNIRVLSRAHLNV